MFWMRVVLRSQLGWLGVGLLCLLVPTLSARVQGMQSYTIIQHYGGQRYITRKSKYQVLHLRHRVVPVKAQSNASQLREHGVNQLQQNAKADRDMAVISIMLSLAMLISSSVCLWRAQVRSWSVYGFSFVLLGMVAPVNFLLWLATTAGFAAWQQVPVMAVLMPTVIVVVLYMLLFFSLFDSAALQPPLRADQQRLDKQWASRVESMYMLLQESRASQNLAVVKLWLGVSLRALHSGQIESLRRRGWTQYVEDVQIMQMQYVRNERDEKVVRVCARLRNYILNEYGVLVHGSRELSTIEELLFWRKQRDGSWAVIDIQSYPRALAQDLGSLAWV